MFTTGLAKHIASIQASSVQDNYDVILLQEMFIAHMGLICFNREIEEFSRSMYDLGFHYQTNPLESFYEEGQPGTIHSLNDARSVSPPPSSSSSSSSSQQPTLSASSSSLSDYFRLKAKSMKRVQNSGLMIFSRCVPSRFLIYIRLYIRIHITLQIQYICIYN